MPTKDELEQAIASLEQQETSYEVCCKLAVYYQLLDRYYGKIKTKYNSNSEFMDAITNTNYDSLLAVIDELMECLAVINPKLYTSVLNKIKAH